MGLFDIKLPKTILNRLGLQQSDVNRQQQRVLKNFYTKQDSQNSVNNTVLMKLFFLKTPKKIPATRSFI
jgi:hypothetical protein